VRFLYVKALGRFVIGRSAAISFAGRGLL